MPKTQKLRIEYMPNYTSQEDIIDFFQKAICCDRKKASSLVFQEQNQYYTNPERARIYCDQLTNAWHGRKIKAGREMFGLRRKGDNPNSLRNKLNALGDRSYTSTEIRAAIQNLTGCKESEIESKATQARIKKIIVRCPVTNTWRRKGAPLPDPSEYGPGNGESKQAHYVRLYGQMPRLSHKPFADYSAKDSEVIAYILAQSGNTDLEWSEAEFNRVKRYGTSPDDKKAVMIYDGGDGKWLGVLTYTCENANTTKEQKGKAAAATSEDDPIRDGDEILYAYIYDDSGNEIERYFLGKPGNRQEISPAAYSKIRRMPVQKNRLAAAKWLQNTVGRAFPAALLLQQDIDERVYIPPLFEEYSDLEIQGYQIKEEYDRELAEAKKQRQERDTEDKQRQNAEMVARDEERTKRWGQKGQFTGELKPEDIFYGMKKGRSLRDFEARAKEYLEYHAIKAEDLTAGKLVKMCVTEGRIIEELGNVNGCLGPTGNYRLA
jgi:hypothetical protein